MPRGVFRSCRIGRLAAGAVLGAGLATLTAASPQLARTNNASERGQSDETSAARERADGVLARWAGRQGACPAPGRRIRMP